MKDTYIKIKKNNKYGYKTLTVYSGPGYVKQGKKLLTITDTGNGYIVKNHAWNSAFMDRYFNLDYDDAEFLMAYLKLIHKENK